MKVQAAVFRKAGEPLVVEEVELRKPQAGEILVKIRASGICHSDISVQNGTMPIPPPMVLGHEGAGEVVEVGEGVTSVAVGDHVILNNVPECGKCPQSHNPRTNLCIESGRNVLTTPVLRNSKYKPFFKTAEGKDATTLMTAGTFATHSLIDAHTVTPIPKDIPFEEAALIACGVITGIGSTHYAAHVSPGSSVAVFGIGSVGLNVIQGAKIAGATVILALDILDSKEAVARQFGATHFINPSKLEGATLHSKIAEILGGSIFVDFAFEATGNTGVLQTAVSIVHPLSGEVVAVGIPHFTSETKFPGPTFSLGRTLRGVLFGNAKSITVTKQIVEWYKAGKIQVKPLITHRLTLQEVNKGMELLAKGEAVRPVILFD
eukprot:Phypoly_transcript_08823.p1 GENE.Phypoly_transcript_08823~~Phypoly_transcript_08823.p1  ORF type:complete len:377 (+),score=49.94 Phypoly_transcript_08823:299-1429(+)